MGRNHKTMQHQIQKRGALGWNCNSHVIQRMDGELGGEGEGGGVSARSAGTWLKSTELMGGKRHDAPSVGNSFPSQIRLSNTLTSFKSSLKSPLQAVL